MDIVLILALILLNGFFAMAEIAIIASRKSKLKNLALAGDKRGKIALQSERRLQKLKPLIATAFRNDEQEE